MAICINCSAIYHSDDTGLHSANGCDVDALPPAGTEIRVRFTAQYVYTEQVRMSDGVVLRHTKEPVINGAP